MTIEIDLSVWDMAPLRDLLPRLEANMVVPRTWLGTRRSPVVARKGDSGAKALTQRMNDAAIKRIDFGLAVALGLEINLDKYKLLLDQQRLQFQLLICGSSPDLVAVKNEAMVAVKSLKHRKPPDLDCPLAERVAFYSEAADAIRRKVFNGDELNVMREKFRARARGEEADAHMWGPVLSLISTGSCEKYAQKLTDELRLVSPTRLPRLRTVGVSHDQIGASRVRFC